MDRFKQINDHYGHLTGDAVLATLAAMIKNEMRGVDAGGRHGGDELSVILAQTGPEGARAFGERLCRAVRITEISFTDSQVGITISVGVASLPECATSAESLVAAADGALYEAKRHGRDRTWVAPLLSDLDPPADGVGRLRTPV